MPVEGDLIFGLAEQNDSGFAATAWLRAAEGGTTTVTVLLFPVQGMDAGAAPADIEDVALPATLSQGHCDAVGS